MSNEYLVVGASGMVGRHVVAELRRRDLPVRPAGRSGPTIFDWDRPETWTPALASVERAYLIWPQGTTQPRHRVAEFIADTAGTSLRRLVVLSAYGVELADGSGLRNAELAVQDSGLDWTFLRPNFFLQNFSEGFYTHTIRARRTVEVPVGDAAVSFVDTRDIAAVAAVALTAEGHAGRGYPITGPAAVTFAEVAAALTAAGHPVTYRDVTPAQTRAALVAAGIAADYADLLVGVYARAAAGDHATVTDAVERVTGRGPRDLATYVRDAAAAGLLP